MAVYDLEEQEQISEIKAWWETYGKLVTTAVVVVAMSSVGWQGWNWYQRKQASEASLLYVTAVNAGSANDAQKVREAAGQLIEKHSGSVYAALGALVAGKAQAEAGDYKNAAMMLAWVSEHGENQAVRDMARLRLAAVQLDEGSFDAALASLSADPLEDYRLAYADLKGDVLFAQGKPDQARAAYAVALELAGSPNDAQIRELIQAKLDALGVAK